MCFGLQHNFPPVSITPGKTQWENKSGVQDIKRKVTAECGGAAIPGVHEAET